MQACPPEILERIVDFCPYEHDPQTYSDEYNSEHSEEEVVSSPLVVCSATCRQLSIIARPRIFKTVKIYEVKHAEKLLALKIMSPNIMQWIKILYIRARRSGIGPTRNNLPCWLASPGGIALMSSLPKVQELRVSRFTWQTDDMVLAKAWDALRLLGGISKLTLDLCMIPTWRFLVELLVTCSRLRFLTLVDIEASNQDLSPLSSSMRDSFEPPSQLIMDSNNPEHPLGGTHWNSLTDLDLAPEYFDGEDQSRSFLYAQELLHHVPLLARLTLSHCSLAPHPRICLEHNPNLKHLSFHGIDRTDDSEWFSSLIRNIPDVSRLAKLEFVGSLSHVSESAWASLDTTLSNARFSSAPGYRKIVIANETPESEGSIEGSNFQRALLSRSQATGWYTIVWTSEG